MLNSHIYDFVIKAPRAVKISREEESAARLSQLPGIQSLGPIHRSTPPIQLTENETEYTVQCIKHIFAQHVVFQVYFPIAVYITRCIYTSYTTKYFLVRLPQYTTRSNT